MTAAKNRLEEAWLARLGMEWALINKQRLQGRLRPPVFALHSGTEKLGRWEHMTRTLSISAAHIVEHAWEEVVETLKHEMAHQVVSELMRVPDSQPHGDLFIRACELLGASPRASVRSDHLNSTETDKILNRVKKLLALADSADVHEAALAMATANTLLLRYNLDMSASVGRPTYVVRRLGFPTKKIPVVTKLIAAILTEYFFVEGVWVDSYAASHDVGGRVFEIMGTPANVELAHYVYDFLLRECDSLWFRAERAVKASGVRGKREFMVGVLLGFQNRLRSERYVNAERGLVWVKDPQLNTFFERRYPKTRTLHGASIRRTSALEQGKVAGEQLTLRRGVHDGPSGRAPKLLSQ